MAKFSSLHNYDDRGFSLIEVVLIVALVAVVFVGVMSLTRRILQMENVVKNDLIAQGLLREGVELAEALRNANVAAGLYFASGLVVTTTPPCDAGPCQVQAAFDWRMVPTDKRSGILTTQNSGLTVNSLPATSSIRLKLSAEAASTTPPFYQLADGVETPFYRYFDISYTPQLPASNNRAMLNVNVYVYWEERGKGHSSKVYFKLYDTAQQ